MSEKKFIYSDFLILSALSDKKNKNLEDVFSSASSKDHFPITKTQFEHAISILSANGYIELTSTALRADSVISLTEKGKAAASVGVLGIIPKMKESVLAKREDEFIAINTEHGAEPSIEISTDEYVALNRKLYAEYDVTVPVIEMRATDGGILFSFRTEGCGYSPEGSGDSELGVYDEDEITRHSTDVLQSVEDTFSHEGLIDAVYDVLSDTPRTRKCIISGSTQSFIISLSPSREGVRMSVSPVKYNRQRFKGKRDGDLDYAQCGESVFDVTVSYELLGAATARAYSSCAQYLNDAILEKIGNIRRLVR